MVPLTGERCPTLPVVDLVVGAMGNGHLTVVPLDSSPVSRPTPNTMTSESRSPSTSPSVLVETSSLPAWNTTMLP
jgi:hypothetical protein